MGHSGGYRHRFRAGSACGARLSIPPAIELLLVTIAIIDDIGAVAIIAAFYTDELVLEPIAAAVVILAIMIGLNRSGVRRLWPYLLGFAALWIAVFHSGVHATLAGVFAAFTVPLGQGEQRSPLKHLEHRLHPVVMFGIVPLFGFGSAGVAIPDGSAAFSQLPLAVALGLFIGKQIGVFGAIWLSDRTGLARKPAALSWGQCVCRSTSLRDRLHDESVHR